MSETNSNEKKNVSERENHANSPENRKNYKNGNGQRNYHQRRPYPRGNNRNVNTTEGDKNPSQNNTNSTNQKKENSNGPAKDLSNTPKRNTQGHVRNVPKQAVEKSSDGNREISKNNRPGNFTRRKNNSGHMRVDETVEDIDIDIGRIEKEIELEIKEISAFKFGM